MDEKTEARIREALLKSWSSETGLLYSKDTAPSYGQCAQTAIVIQEIYGGEILKTDGWPRQDGSGTRGRHFYNQINGKRHDFTAGQFTEMTPYTCDIEYKDLPSSPEEAATETRKSQIDALRIAFKEALKMEG